MSLITEILQTFLYFYDVLLAVSGIALCVAGIFLRITEQNYINIFEDSFLSLGSWSLCLGLVILAISCLGGYAVFKEKKNWLLTFAVLLMLLFIVQAALGLVASLAINPENRIFDTIEGKFRASFKNNDTELLKILDKIQKNFHCCGLEGPQDYNQTRFMSCTDEDCSHLHRDGCVEIYGTSIQRKIKIIAYVAFIFAVPVPIGVCFTLALRNRGAGQETEEEEGEDT